MKSFNTINRNRWFQVRVPLFMVLLWILMAVPALALDVSSKEEALRIVFKGSDKIVKKKIVLSGPQKREIGKLANQKITEKRLIFYVGMKGDTPTGYAMIESQKNRSWTISYLTLVNLDGTVKDVEVLNYEGARIWSIQYDTWLKQFFGKDANSDFTPSSITGATVSARTIAQGVNKAVAAYKVIFLDKVK